MKQRGQDVINMFNNLREDFSADKDSQTWIDRVKNIRKVCKLNKP